MREISSVWVAAGSSSWMAVSCSHRGPLPGSNSPQGLPQHPRQIRVQQPLPRRPLGEPILLQQCAMALRFACCSDNVTYHILYPIELCVARWIVPRSTPSFAIVVQQSILPLGHRQNHHADEAAGPGGWVREVLPPPSGHSHLIAFEQRSTLGAFESRPSTDSWGAGSADTVSSILVPLRD